MVADAPPTRAHSDAGAVRLNRTGEPVTSTLGVERRPGRPDSDRRWDRLRTTLVLGWLLVIAAAALVGERTSSWDDVQGLVASGEVEQVRVSGELPGQGTGYALVEIHWRHGPLRYTAEVVQVRGRVSPGETAGLGAPVVRTSPANRLSALQPGLQVTRDQRLSSGGPVLGWHVPGPVAIAAFLLTLAGLGALVSGPEPWRATRWAWFWLLLTPPVVSVVFLVLSGPTAGVPRPRCPHRRLTGGWAFLLFLLLGGVSGT